MKKYYIILLSLIFSNMLIAQSYQQVVKYSDFSNACSDILKQKLFELDFQTPNQNKFISDNGSYTVIFSPEKTMIKIANKKAYNILKSDLSDNCKQIDFIWNEDIKSYETMYKCSNSTNKNIKSSTKIKTYKTLDVDPLNLFIDSTGAKKTPVLYVFEIKCNNLNKIINIDPKLNLDLNR